MEVQTQNLAGQLADYCKCYSATIQIKGTTHLHYLQVAETDCKPTRYYVRVSYRGIALCIANLERRVYQSTVFMYILILCSRRHYNSILMEHSSQLYLSK